MHFLFIFSTNKVTQKNYHNLRWQDLQDVWIINTKCCAERTIRFEKNSIPLYQDQVQHHKWTKSKDQILNYFLSDFSALPFYGICVFRFFLSNWIRQPKFETDTQWPSLSVLYRMKNFLCPWKCQIFTRFSFSVSRCSHFKLVNI